MEAPTARPLAKGEVAIKAAVERVEESDSIGVVHLKAEGSEIPNDAIVGQPLYLVKTDKWDSTIRPLLSTPGVTAFVVTNIKNNWAVVVVGSEEVGSKGARAKIPKFVQQFKAKQVRAEEEKRAQAQKDAEYEKFKDTFGLRPVVEAPISDSNPRRKYVEVKSVSASFAGSHVWLRGRVHQSRPVSSALIFLVIRHQVSTVQVVISTPPEFVKFAKGIYNESIIDIYGLVKTVAEPVDMCTVKDAEIAVEKLFIVSMAIPKLPIEIEAASRPEHLIEARDAEIKAIVSKIKDLEEAVAGASGQEKVGFQAALDDAKEQQKKLKPYAAVGLNTRLDNRVLDLRTPANLSIFALQSGVCRIFREVLTHQGFMEIHTPKLISTASEGGAEVFKCEYFENHNIPFAYLAQSPQLYKQMAIAADFEKVFEIGPVFRREDANTHRHMNEFVGLDLEMVFKQHYTEVIDLLDHLFVQLFTLIETQFATELKVICEQHPFKPFRYLTPSLRLQWPEAISLLQAELAKPVQEIIDPVLGAELLEQLKQDGKANVGDFDDLSTKAEKLLGRVVANKYNTDFYILDHFPSAIRPFYTMPDPLDERYSNSYDLFIRGEEICSGAQRIHNPTLLAQRAEAKGVPPASLKDYIDSFSFAAEPHGGGGIGLERVVMLYLGLPNIRKSSLFPRDPYRLTP
eukprot:TRINITY_DN2360_c0_g1_i2.p1 TRINITY_DN2360_c0_g1~~TRINITY_DN2360_c0_g1_i2.p1  ORF type:complete len:684 (-),score=146.19 TRINITY_DN2360_c0_g1_i2:23-2074(-)